MSQSVTRRKFLETSIGTLGLTLGNRSLDCSLASDVKPREKLPIAGVVTVYHHNSHADVIVGKVLEGWTQNGGFGPDLKLVSLYVDQVGTNDRSGQLSKKHGFRLAKTIREALTLGTDSLAVSGILSIGEHGDYPIVPETQQVMYPRRRFFDEIVATLRSCHKVVPVFNDKHLSYAWRDARHMFDTARDMRIPFMAGSSVPVMWRDPSATIAIGTEITEAIALGSGSLDHHGIHTLEGLQCLVERRKGGETGVKSVQSVQRDGIWQAEKAGHWSMSLFDALVAASPLPYAGKAARPKEMSKDAVFFLVEYSDGLKATIAMNTGLTHEFACGVSIRGADKPFTVTFLPQDGIPFGHFEHLLRAIEHMIHTGKPAYPVDRTLLTTGILDAALRSQVEHHNRLETPHLAVAYAPVEWPFPKGMPPPVRS